MLWIWNRFKCEWTDGIHRITQEVIERYSWEKVRIIVFHEWGIILPKQRFQVPKKIFIEPEWIPLTPEEVMKVLNPNKCSCAICDYSIENR